MIANFYLFSSVYFSHKINEKNKNEQKFII